jgi:hypothetical protein
MQLALQSKAEFFDLAAVRNKLFRSTFVVFYLMVTVLTALKIPKSEP